ncbi:RNA methyltransferase [Bizionia paragorgiae]|jgi:RNA methyltransferase, TrmH family|uniref:RNA methyltransferase n=1 Tax=Bizionia paragorgiae TaxID=283786 RepID=UPI00299DF216|nr:RNA methyltransferase [Bizionia paragorgiae]MDX1271022.1 RNA methyltransferase [Bizionia paragorgiae]
MLSKSQIKVITRLKQKKYRVQDGIFVAEGIKVINELLDSHLELQHLFTTVSFGTVLEKEQLITEAELKKISFLKTPNKALALFKIPQQQAIPTNQFVVALDNVRDPGNLGTIIRLCDWFGVEELVCNTETVDCYNPKVIQATMGSITRVNVSYIDLESYLKASNSPVFGAFMDGDNVYKTTLPETGILVLGNEANGISPEIEALVTNRIAIPRFGALQATESLNVATATAILLSEFKRGK